MNFKKIIKRLLIVILIALVVFGLINYCASRIDQSRKEKKERNEKIETGVCDFDKIDLENFSIKNGSRSFKSILDLSALKNNFSDQLGRLNVNDTSLLLKTFRIDNNDFAFYQRGTLAAINSIELDFSSQFTFTLNDKLAFSPQYKLQDFEEQYPKSFSCRESITTSNVTEVFALRIDNSVETSKFKFIVLYFNHAENLYKVEFYYEDINLIYK